MELLVLAKAVPAIESLDFDRISRTVRRDVGPMFLNPFDQRALRVALELRSPGERVTVLSMGPPSAAPVLREARAVGADRAVLICDPALAGSDSVATATVLAAAVAQLRPGAIFAGAWTTDSETGAVGPELAALLDWPVLTQARAIRRPPGSSTFEVVVDTENGWRSWRARAPVVLTVGEKIAKPLRPTPEALAAVRPDALERWSARDLGIEPTRVGLNGSPTWVGAVVPAAPTRAGRRCDSGSVAERVAHAVEELARRLGSAPPGPAPLPAPPARRSADRESLVFVTDETGRLDREALGIVAALRRRIPEGWPSVLWLGPPPTEEETVLLERAGALAGYFVRAAVPVVDAAAAAHVTTELLYRRPELAAIAFGAGPFGRSVAGLVAGHRRLGLVGDAVDLAAGPDGSLVWSKPSFGGRTIAQVRCRTRPHLATVRAGGFAIPERGAPGGFGWNSLSIAVPVLRLQPIDAGVEHAGCVPLDGREVVVAVGMGIGGPEGVARIAPTVAAWDAGLAATRRVVDAGWVPRQLQVGLTGRSLAPRLAVLLGVSGSVNHSIGWQRAGTVLAVNRDPAAPVFRDADIGIVGTVEEVLPALAAPVARLLGR